MSDEKSFQHVKIILPLFRAVVKFIYVIYKSTLFISLYSFSGSSISEFDSQTLAVLRGRVVRYLMRSKEVCLCDLVFGYTSQSSDLVRTYCREISHIFSNFAIPSSGLSQLVTYSC